jgi:hypothetical protein
LIGVPRNSGIGSYFFAIGDVFFPEQTSNYAGFGQAGWARFDFAAGRAILAVKLLEPLTARANEWLY